MNGDRGTVSWSAAVHIQHMHKALTRLHNQMESLLEEMQIKLSSVLSDLLGASGQRILRALAEGETDAEKLASLVIME